jgi:hypothetical protein
MNTHVSVQEKNHRMPVSAAAKWTTLYREKRNSMLEPEYQHKDVLCVCETFNAKAVQELLNLPDCQGLRIYYGMDATNSTVHAILCRANSKGEDIYLPSTDANGSLLADGEGDVLEDSNRCPPLCPTDSPLNS